MTCLIVRVLVGLTVAVFCVASVPLYLSRTTTADAQVDDRKPYQQTGAEGVLIGKVLFQGETPTRKRIVMSQDASCAAISRNPRSEDVIVTDGKLANVFVYVKGALLEGHEGVGWGGKRTGEGQEGDKRETQGFETTWSRNQL